MANLVITSNSLTVNVDFGDYAIDGKFPKQATFKRSGIFQVSEKSEWIDIDMNTRQRYQVTDDTSSTSALIVDSVDGVAPTSLEDLKDKIVALIL